MRQCIQCQGIDLRAGRQTVSVEVPTASGPMEVKVSGLFSARCATCSESYLRGLDLERVDLLAAAETMRRGLWDGKTLRFTRTALGLTATELANLLGVSAEAVAQWECGHGSAERSVCNTLADLVADELTGRTTTIDRLRGPAGPPDRSSVSLTLGNIGALSMTSQPVTRTRAAV